MATYRPIELWNPIATLTSQSDGCLLMRTTAPLDDYPPRMSDRLLHWASVAPERTFMARRVNDGEWRHITYREALAFARSIGQALLDRGLGPDRPIAILSENDLEHAMLALGADFVGVPYASISTAYSLISKDFDKLRHIIGLLTPGMVFVSHGERYGAAIDAVIAKDCEVVYTSAQPALHTRAISFAALASTLPRAEVDTARLGVGPDTVAKFLFTSGSTNAPKGVINTQRMLTSNQQMIAQAWPFLTQEPPVLVDWLPWSHTFGGNHNIGITLTHGGTLYIDDGKPVPALFNKTLNNLREIAPTVYFNVPRGFEELAIALHADAALAKLFFSKLKMWFFAGASLPQAVLDSLQAAAVKTIGQQISMQSGLGMTETAPWAIGFHHVDFKAGNLGVPGAGVTCKLVPNDGKLELRYKGDNITPGYWRAPEQTKAAFDDDGYFKSGDAVKLLDAQNPSAGLAFDGRIAEDFKLATGTWVSVGPLRGKIIAYGAPFVQDVVITGHDRDEVGAIIVPHLESCRKVCVGAAQDATLNDLVASDTLRNATQQIINRLVAESTGSATRVTRAVLLAEPLSLDKGEVTDKGSVNQRAVLANRAALVNAMYDGSLTALISAS